MFTIPDDDVAPVGSAVEICTPVRLPPLTACQHAGRARYHYLQGAHYGGDDMTGTDSKPSDGHAER